MLHHRPEVLATLAIGAFLVLGPALGCGPSADAPAPEPAKPAAAPAAPKPAAAPAADYAAEANEIFVGRCVTCHGATGAGDGPGSAALDPKPRNFGDAAWQAEVSDDHLTKIILYGGAAVGRSPAMPGNPDLIAKKEVVAALIVHVRDLGTP